MTGVQTCALPIFAGGSLTAEIRAVNHRYLDVQFRMPEELRAIEPQLRELMAAKLNRGKVECRINHNAAEQAAGAGTAPALNEARVKELATLNDAVCKLLPRAAPLSASEVLRWPGVLATETVSADTLRETCAAVVGQALDEFMAARAREGAKLREAILAHADALEARVATVTPRLPAAIAAFQEKLTQRLRDALGAVGTIGDGGDERIRQEIALYAAKIDVDEELTRLKTHVAELRRILAKGGAAGKRLDFLMQELNREANTLGSKAADIEITQVSMDLKLLIEQMREQIQNIE